MKDPRKSEKVRIGVIGLGAIGRRHAEMILRNEVSGLELAGVCDSSLARSEPFDVAKFSSAEDMFRSPTLDAILVATPHRTHVSLARAAIRAGKHVLIEKPLGVSAAECDELIEELKAVDGLVAGVMLNERTNPLFRAVKQLVDSGELERIFRVQWTITDWFRTETYFRSENWRGTWRGEGGGALLNQCVHQLDLLHWLFGMPVKLWANCKLGKHHNIEVEDEVTAYLDYPGGMTASFVASTGESPGVNRLEVISDRGVVVLEGGNLRFLRNDTLSSFFSKTSAHAFAKPSFCTLQPPIKGKGGQHREVLENFAAAVASGVPLIGSAMEALRSVELANAMLLSSWTERPVHLPMNRMDYSIAFARAAGTDVAKN